jgi:hypothetical protein
MLDSKSLHARLDYIIGELYQLQQKQDAQSETLARLLNQTDKVIEGLDHFSADIINWTHEAAVGSSDTDGTEGSKDTLYDNSSNDTSEDDESYFDVVKWNEQKAN